METFQTSFHRQWQHLHDPHVRALAWLLTSPNLLDSNSVQWSHHIATLLIDDTDHVHDWLSGLDQHPSVLHQALEIHKHKRLGHYAEDLLAFYLQHQGKLHARNLQVNQENRQTMGEFDFLIQLPAGLLHWEIATKFYLFHCDETISERVPDAYDFLGPNLADTLGAKMHKIIKQQLALSHNMTAKLMLSQPVMRAQALVKGWLFYHTSHQTHLTLEGIAPDHCRGFWWTLADLEKIAIPHALVLPRLAWLAPAQCDEDQVLDRLALLETLHRQMQRDQMPVMVAIMSKHGAVMQEFCRGMVVPDDWRTRANEKQRQFR